MTKRLSGQEKRRLTELESNGVTIDEVYGSRRASSLYLCLSKALIIFLVCAGTVTGFCDAFSLPYNRGTVFLASALASAIISLLYVKKKFFYIGYVVLLVAFTLELLRYYLYANSGFQAIMNTVREKYANHFNMGVVRSAEETYSNRSVTITVALIFIIIFLVIMYNITISRYMNFAETFFISFIILEIPLYIGYKPPLFSVVLIMTGCIATALLQRGAFNRVTIPGKKAPDYIRDRLFKKTYYTTRGTHKGILIAIGFSLLFSVVICVFSIPAYDRKLGETPENSAKSSLDDTIKIFVQNGLSGFFNRYDSLNGLARGALGGVSSVSPDFQTDLVVDYVPYNLETVYLPGFKGVEYTGQYWHEYITRSQAENSYISADEVDAFDDRFTREMIKNDFTSAKMQINYIDMGFGMFVSPYITLPENVSDGKNPLMPERQEGQRTLGVIASKDIEYLPQREAEYNGSYIFNYDSIWYDSDYTAYVYKYCTTIPKDLKKYLKSFLEKHGDLGLDLKGYRNKFLSGQMEETNNFRLDACAKIADMFVKEYPYSLSPGKTPTDQDFVQYFLEYQKRGYCSHFASTAVMILRSMGIPARYVEGYVIPASLLREEAKKLDVDGSTWYEGENTYNPDKNVYSVEVSDYYAHAWVEVYLEGKGFVPYEVTPPSYEATPEPSMGGLREFFSRLMDVDLGFGDSSEGTMSVIGNVTQEVVEGDGPDLNIIIIPLGIVIAVAAVFWLLFLLIKKILKEIKYSGYLKQGNFAPLVYGRYNDFVKKLKRKKIITGANPLPLELFRDLTEYCLKMSAEKGKDTEALQKLSSELEKMSLYIEKVLYSSYVTDASEYEEFHRFIKDFRYK